MMKKKYILSICFALAAMTGCKKSLDQSINPNQPSVATPGNVLSGALVTTAVRTAIDYNTFGIWLGYYAPSGNFTTSTVTLNYSFTTATFNFFTSNYNNITNYNVLIAAAKADPTLNNYAAIAMIMTAYDYQVLVDNYNDVPYSQAIQANTILFPAYDKGQDIYNDLMVKLDAAIAMINSSTSAVNPGSTDVYFKGTMASWKKFANTIKLRIALRQSNITANKAALVTELAKTAAEGYLDDTVFAQCQPGYLNIDANNGQQNPYYKQYGITQAGAQTTGYQTTRANNFFINFLSPKNDPRISRIYDPVGGAIVGNTLGSSSTLTNTFTSPLGQGILTVTGPQPVLSGSEACFLLSDGIVEGFLPATVNGATAQNYYERGITASFVALGVPSAATAAATYYNQVGVVDVNWAASLAAPAPTGTGAGYSNLVRAILTQKYIADFGYDVFETYNDYRRTGLPDLSGARTVTAGALGTGPVPNRVYFPSGEISTNAANVAAEPAVDPFVSKIFWAK